MSAVIFDLDGTLVDSLQDIRAAINHVLASRGLPPRSPEEIERYVGHGARVLVRRALRAAGAEPENEVVEEEALAQFRARYMEHLVVHTRPYPGVRSLLRSLAQRGIPTAVLSNKPHVATRRVVAELLGQHPFVEVLGERPDVPRKPDPTAALELARVLGREPAQVHLVGDTPVDVETGKAAGMDPIAVLWGMRTREQLAAAGATRFVESPEELLHVLGDG